ncbi:hypothetical protein M3J09_002730 [Ascochyta lentis]
MAAPRMRRLVWLLSFTVPKTVVVGMFLRSTDRRELPRQTYLVFVEDDITFCPVHFQATNSRSNCVFKLVPFVDEPSSPKRTTMVLPLMFESTTT